MMLSLLFAATLVMGPSSSPPPISERAEVQRLAEEATQAFGRGDYARAAEHLQRALVLEPDNPALIYGLAQARRGLDDCQEAIALYDRFLRTDPTPRQRADALDGRARCGATTPPPEPEPDPPLAEVEPAPPDPEPEPERSPRMRPRPPPLGPILVGTGSALALGGAGMAAGAFGLAARAPSAPTQDRYLDQAARTRPLAIAGWSLLGTGVTVAVVGVVTWAVQRRQRGEASARMRRRGLARR